MQPSIGRLRLEMLAVSFLALFLELAFIRYINSTVQVVAYFNNFMLLSAFLGLGLGSTLVREGARDWFRWLPLVFIGFVALLVGLDRVSIAATMTDVVYWTIQ